MERTGVLRVLARRLCAAVLIITLCEPGGLRVIIVAGLVGGAGGLSGTLWVADVERL